MARTGNSVARRPDRQVHGWEDDWAKGPTANSHGARGDESWSSMQRYSVISENWSNYLGHEGQGHLYFA